MYHQFKIIKNKNKKLMQNNKLKLIKKFNKLQINNQIKKKHSQFQDYLNLLVILNLLMRYKNHLPQNKRYHVQ